MALKQGQLVVQLAVSIEAKGMEQSEQTSLTCMKSMLPYALLLLLPPLP